MKRRDFEKLVEGKSNVKYDTSPIVLRGEGGHIEIIDRLVPRAFINGKEVQFEA